MGIQLAGDQFDELLAKSQQTACSHLEFLDRVLSPLADQRRQRSIERRIRQARFRDEAATLEAFDWKFNRSINRTQIDELATADFVRRGDNLVLAGQSGLGKSHIMQSIGRCACVAGYRVRYTTSAELLRELGASLADGTTPKKVRHYSRFDLLIIDEFGFDRLERDEFPQAPGLLYKVIDGRTRQCSTALVTNIDFDAWGEYLGDAPLAMALLDRLVDGALILKQAADLGIKSQQMGSEGLDSTKGFLEVAGKAAEGRPVVRKRRRQEPRWSSVMLDQRTIGFCRPVPQL